MTRRLFAAALILAGCGGSRATPTPASSFAEDAPLNGFASLPMIVMPAQGIRVDTLGWGSKVNDRRAFLASVDSALAQAVRDRGLTAWTLPSTLVQTARRNPNYVANPADVRAADAVAGNRMGRGREPSHDATLQVRAAA